MKRARNPALADCRCLRCNELIDAASPAEDDGGREHPRPGDVSICVACGMVSIYGGTPARLALRPILASEVGEVLKHLRAMGFVEDGTLH